MVDTVDYSGDTDKYTAPTIKDIKPEPTVDNVPDLKNANVNPIATCSTRNVLKPSRAKPKQKPTKSVKDQNTASPVLKLKKGGSKGEWHIKGYARVKYKKACTH